MQCELTILSFFFLPKTFLTVIAVSDRLYVGAVGIMICEHILADRQKIDFLGFYRRMTHAYLCPDYRDCEEDWQNPDKENHSPIKTLDQIFLGVRVSEEWNSYHTQCLVNSLPAVSQSAERAGVVRIDDDHKPGIRSVKYVSNALCQDICTFWQRVRGEFPFLQRNIVTV